MRTALSVVLATLAVTVFVLHGRGVLAHSVSVEASTAPGAISGSDARRRESLIEAHRRVPRDEIVGPSALQRELLAELEVRFEGQFTALHRQVTAAGARMVVAYLSPEFESDAQKVLEPFLRTVALGLGVDYVNLMPGFAGLDPKLFTQMPRDGHFSARGAVMVAEELREVLARYSEDRSPVSWPAAARPSLLGDLDPGQDVILDGGKGLPYRLQTNRQGLRLDHEVTFPKVRQRVLLLGDSQVHGPFLDNDQTIGSRLQTMVPDREVITVANLGYGLDDLEAMFRERARFLEPDLVVVTLSGGDVFDTYFSNRNLFSRSGRPFEPTALEQRFEREVMGVVDSSR
jgi:hypothetical protein